MVDLKNVKVDFPPNSAYAVLLGLVLNCGIDSVLSALGEIAAQPMRALDGACTCGLSNDSFHPNTWHEEGCPMRQPRQ